MIMKNLIKTYKKDIFKQKLNSLGDKKYCQFVSKLGIGDLKPLGIKVPELKKIAKQFALSNWQEFFCEEENFCPEVIILKGLCIGYAKIDIDTFLTYLHKFFDMVESWTETDCTAPSFKIIIKNREKVWQEILPYIFCEGEYKTRLAIIILLDYFLLDEWIDKVLDILPKIKQGDYYVDMALAWILSVCFVKFRDKTLKLFEQKCFSKFVHNKAIQKCRESFRVLNDDKELLKTYKI